MTTQNLLTLKTPWPKYRFFMGVDLGQAFDPTAIAIIREMMKPRDEPVTTIQKNPALIHEFAVVHLERLELGTPYPVQIEHIKRLCRRTPLTTWPTRLAVDATGVGKAVSDMMIEKRLHHDAITITAGDGTSRDGRYRRVGKSRLVGTLLATMHDERLKFAKELPGSDILRKELMDFRVSYTDAGNAIFNAREGQHDDLVLAVSIAHWIACVDKPGEVRYSNLY